MHALVYSSRFDRALEIVAIVLFIGWLLGFLSGYTWGGAIHTLLGSSALLVSIRWLNGFRRR